MPETTPQSVRALRRQQIVEAARALVADEGLEALTIAALEDRVAFTRGVITYHFANKDEIVHALFASAIAEIDDAMSARVNRFEPGPGQIEAVVRSMIHGFLTHEEAGQIVIAFWARLRVDARARKANATLYARYRRRSARMIRAGQKRGRFRPDVHATAFATHVVGTVIGIVVQTLMRGERRPGPHVVDEAVASLLAHLVPRRPTRAAARK